MKELQQHLLYLLLLAAVQTAGSLVQNQYPRGRYIAIGTDCSDSFSPWLTEDTPGEDDELPGGGSDDALSVLQLCVQPCWQ